MHIQHIGKEYLIDLFLYPLILGVDKDVLGYFSKGGLLENEAYKLILPTWEQGEKNYDFIVYKKDFFDEIIPDISELGQKYLQPVYEMVLDCYPE